MVKTDINDYKFPVIVISVAVIVATALALFLGRPLWNGMQEKRKELKAKKELLTALEVKLENLKSLASREQELKEKNAKVLAALPTDSDVSRLFVQFEKVGAGNGVTVKKVSESTQNATAQGTIKQLGYEVFGSANSYPNFRSAVQKFQTALRILGIEGFEISQSGTSGKSLESKINILTYTRGEDEN